MKNVLKKYYKINHVLFQYHVNNMYNIFKNLLLCKQKL